MNKSDLQFHPISKVLQKILSDESVAYNVGFYDQDGNMLCHIGCISKKQAEKLSALANECSWVDLP